MVSVRTLLDQLGIDVIRTFPSIRTNGVTGFIKRYEKFKNIGVLDTSIGSRNLGDFIIMKSVYEHINNMFGNSAYISTFPTHLHVVGKDRKLIAEKELLFVGGTNIINCENIRSQWKLRRNDLKFYNNRCVLMGCGASAYGRAPTASTIFFLRSVLSDRYVHSVRDEYTKKVLNDMGFFNVINTCCPTTWNLRGEGEPELKKENVVTTITDYNQDPEQDKRMLDILSRHYKKIHVWIQNINDFVYLKELIDLERAGNIFLISPSLDAYRQHLESNGENLDYVGTRLHAGIYAMQFGVRSLIVGIDNRAKEIGRDINMNIVDRSQIEDLHEFIEGKTNVALKLPVDRILEWKHQFK